MFAQLQVPYGTCSLFTAYHIGDQEVDGERDHPFGRNGHQD